MKPYTVKQALTDAHALGLGRNLRLTFASVRDAGSFRQSVAIVRRRDRLARGGSSPWDGLGTKLIKNPDGTAVLEIGRWDGRKATARRSQFQPVKIEIIEQERSKS